MIRRALYDMGADQRAEQSSDHDHPARHPVDRAAQGIGECAEHRRERDHDQGRCLGTLLRPMQCEHQKGDEQDAAAHTERSGEHSDPEPDREVAQRDTH